MSAAFALGVDFSVFTCCHEGCGVQVVMTSEYEGFRRKDHASFYCLNGHPQGFQGKTEAQRLREQLEAKEQSLKYAREETERYSKRLRAQRAQTSRFRNKLEKTKQRVGHGVCPCCNRTFQLLQRHMKTKHPEFAGEREPGDLHAVDEEVAR